MREWLVTEKKAGANDLRLVCFLLFDTAPFDTKFSITSLPISEDSKVYMTLRVPAT